MRLTPYQNYKSSGIEWLGDVPVHWDVRRLKSICFFAYGDSLDSDSRTKGDIKVYGSNGNIGFHSLANTEAPCLIIGRKGSFGKVHYSPNPVFAIDTTFFVDGHCSPANIRWLYYLLGWLRLDDVSKDSAVPGLHRSDAHQRLIVYPPLPEQVAIVHYLDYFERRIQRYIRAKQKLIKLLEEQKQAVIHRAVTRGLAPDVPLKPSGVEWLGDVPAHWKVRRLKFLAKIETGGRDTVDREKEGVYPFFVRSQIVERINSYAFDGEAVLTAGDGAGVAKVFHYFVGKFDYHQRVYKFSDFRKITGKYFFYFFRNTLRFEAFRETAKSTVDSLRLPMLQNFPVLLPPYNEQKEIVRVVETDTADINAKITLARQQTDLMREYRTRLIADVVTGKLDVRKAAAELPDESDNPKA